MVSHTWHIVGTRQTQLSGWKKKPNHGRQSTKCSANTRKGINIVFLGYCIGTYRFSNLALLPGWGVTMTKDQEPQPGGGAGKVGTEFEGHCSTQRPSYPGHWVSTWCLPSDSLWRAESPSLCRTKEEAQIFPRCAACQHAKRWNKNKVVQEN